MKYKRVSVKLSGGAVAGKREFGFDHESLAHLVNELLSVAEAGVALSVVIGGGNILVHP